MKKFILGWILGWVAIFVGAFLYVRSGHAPVATNSGPLPMETFFAKTALHATVAPAAKLKSPLPVNSDNLFGGVMVYNHNCAFCHGEPHQNSKIAEGMFPRPPQLFTPHGMVTDDPVGITFWKVKNGIRLSGMPAFQSKLSQEQMWQVSLLLSHANQLPAAVGAALK